MKNLYLLPTDKPSRLWLSTRKENYLIFDKFPRGGAEYVEPKNIYITSEKDIKEGDGKYPVLSCKGTVYKDCPELWKGSGDWKKIILTTDQDLIKDGVQAIDDEFLEWFVKNPKCEFIEVIDKLRYFNIDELRERHLNGLPYIYHEKIGYQIIIPKEEPKKEILEERKPYWNLVDIKAEQNNIIDLNAYANGVEDGVKWQKEQDKNLYSEGLS